MGVTLVVVERVCLNAGELVEERSHPWRHHLVPSIRHRWQHARSDVTIDLRHYSFVRHFCRTGRLLLVGRVITHSPPTPAGHRQLPRPRRCCTVRLSLFKLSADRSQSACTSTIWAAFALTFHVSPGDGATAHHVTTCHRPLNSAACLAGHVCRCDTRTIWVRCTGYALGCLLCRRSRGCRPNLGWENPGPQQ